MSKIIGTLTVFPLAALTAWLGGYDFDTRSVGVAYSFVVTCVIAGFVYIYPGWDD